MRFVVDLSPCDTPDEHEHLYVVVHARDEYEACVLAQVEHAHRFPVVCEWLPIDADEPNPVEHYLAEMDRRCALMFNPEDELPLQPDFPSAWVAEARNERARLLNH